MQIKHLIVVHSLYFFTEVSTMSTFWFFFQAKNKIDELK